MKENGWLQASEEGSGLQAQSSASGASHWTERAIGRSERSEPLDAASAASGAIKLERRKLPSRVGPCNVRVQVKVPVPMPEFIYTMHNVRKTLGDKVVLDNVTLSFYFGAKIGVVGPNGTGKSTLLKVMAGIEKPNNGDAMLAKDATVGILLQEPPLTEGKTVFENVEEGVAHIKALQARMEELGVAMGEPDADFDTLMAEMGEVQTELDARNA
jgi:ABC-type multidrug transport system fused ATPase/permease subunit